MHTMSVYTLHLYPHGDNAARKRRELMKKKNNKINGRSIVDSRDKLEVMFCKHETARDKL